jgi:hypothetical protein
MPLRGTPHQSALLRAIAALRERLAEIDTLIGQIEEEYSPGGGVRSPTQPASAAGQTGIHLVPRKPKVRP